MATIRQVPGIPWTTLAQAVMAPSGTPPKKPPSSPSTSPNPMERAVAARASSMEVRPP